MQQRVVTFEQNTIIPWIDELLTPQGDEINKMLRNKLIPEAKFSTKDGMSPKLTTLEKWLSEIFRLGWCYLGTHFRQYSNPHTVLTNAELYDLFSYNTFKIQTDVKMDRIIPYKLHFNRVLQDYLQKEAEVVHHFCAHTDHFSTSEYGSLCYNLQRLSENFDYFVNNLCWNVLYRKNWCRPHRWAELYEQALQEAYSAELANSTLSTASDIGHSHQDEEKEDWDSLELLANIANSQKKE
jgi:hypothetical protein